MSVAMRARHGWLLAPALACLFVVGCGDDDGDDPVKPAVDGGGAGDSGTSAKVDGGPGPGLDAGLDSGLKPDGGPAPGPDAGPGITDNVVFAQISPTGHDRFYGVTHDSAGNIYAVGQTSSAIAAGSDSSFVLAKFSAAGVLDTTFGASGYAIKNIVEGGLDVETARGVVIQADGKIVVAGQAEHQVYGAGADAGALVRDADVFVVRFTAQGQLDSTFGTAGVVRQDVGTGILTQPATTDAGVPAMTLSGSDSFWSLSLTSDNKLVIHTATRGLGGSIDGGVRTDTDFALVRLNADGALDTTFGATGGTPGTVRTDFSNTNASVRAATVLPNGSIVATGYSSNPVLTGTNAQNPVLYKVNADGSPDTTFGATDPVTTPGLWHDFARRDMKNAEAYGAALQGSKFVTLGYGPTPNTTGSGSDLIYFRFDANGLQDRTFGTDGVTFIDIGGLGDNGRCVATLPDNRIIGGGIGRVKPATPPAAGTTAPADAVLSVISENGQPDPSFGANGVRTYDFGGPGDQIHGLSVAPNKKQVAAVGVKTGATATDDDDGAIVILNLP